MKTKYLLLIVIALSLLLVFTSCKKDDENTTTVETTTTAVIPAGTTTTANDVTTTTEGTTATTAASTIYTVTFTGVDTAISAQEIEEGGVATRPTAPERTGFSFDGWYIGEDKFNFSTPITADTVLTAKWSEAKYYVTFYDQEGSILEANEYAYNATTVVAPEPTESEDELFLGWFTEENGAGTAFDATAPVVADINYYPSMGKAVTLKFFDEDMTTLIKKYKLSAGQKQATPPFVDKSEEGKEFDGYFTEGNVAYDEDTAYTASTSFYAKYTQYFDVKFMDGETEKGSFSLKAGETVTAPTMPTADAEGRAFLGWFDADGKAFTATVSASVTYIAKYEAKNVTVSFVLPDGSPVLRNGTAYTQTVKEGSNIMLPVGGDPLYNDTFYSFALADMLNIKGNKSITLTPVSKTGYTQKSLRLDRGPGEEAFTSGLVTSSGAIKGWGVILWTEGQSLVISGNLAGPVALYTGTTSGNGNELQGTVTLDVYLDDVKVNTFTLSHGQFYDQGKTICTIDQPGEHEVRVEVAELKGPDIVESSGVGSTNSAFKGAICTLLVAYTAPSVAP